MKESYRYQAIEEKWQAIWDKQGVFRVHEDPQKPKFYCLEMYPYPSGRIHMGHVRNFSIVDVISRFKKMRGFNVLHPIGWDAFGMPAENAAIKRGIHPQDWTLGNIAHMKSQLQRLGFSYDWDREVTTCLPEYYKWNQWIFLQMLERGLAFRKKSVVNWCPRCETVLANEQVVGERCWRCDTQVEEKDMEQWFLKITAYAEELLSGHDLLRKWPEHVLAMQRNWIGKSKGAHVMFPVKGMSDVIEVFTTRLDTIFGATFMVLSPQHPLVHELIGDSPEKKKIEEWVQAQRAAVNPRGGHENEDKQGIDTGKRALNPYTGEEMPIWIANYVLMEYGTGAIMAVPAHDERDNEFARKYRLPIRRVIEPEKARKTEEQEALFTDYGRLVNSGPYSGKTSREAIEEMAEKGEREGFGRISTVFRLRDWGISRQRYWGTPIPVIYCTNCGIVGVPVEDLPIRLPYEAKFKGVEGSPLEKVEDFLHTTCPRCGGSARRETDTMDTFFDSSWYYFRYCSPQESSLPFQVDSASYWLPVDIYVGGVEHAILHLIYARFFCKILRDLGLTDVSEPFPHYLGQGMVTKDGSAMSKSKGNVVDPDEMIAKYGVDSVRLFILFAAPPEKEFAWNEKGIEGCFRFVHRIWAFFQDNLDLFAQPEPDALPDDKAGLGLEIKMHQTIKKVTKDLDQRFHMNTAISSIMEMFNRMKKDREALRASAAGRGILRQAMRNLVFLLSPFAPHVCDELGHLMHLEGLVSQAPWPDFDADLAQEDMVTVVVQVNGKLRDKFDVERDLAEEEIKHRALELPRIQSLIDGREIRKIVCIKNKLVNIVV